MQSRVKRSTRQLSQIVHMIYGVSICHKNHPVDHYNNIYSIYGVIYAKNWEFYSQTWVAPTHRLTWKFSACTTIFESAIILRFETVLAIKIGSCMCVWWGKFLCYLYKLFMLFLWTINTIYWKKKYNRDLWRMSHTEGWLLDRRLDWHAWGGLTGAQVDQGFCNYCVYI
jgi:hypothetical protein